MIDEKINRDEITAIQNLIGNAIYENKAGKLIACADKLARIEMLFNNNLGNYIKHIEWKDDD